MPRDYKEIEDKEIIKFFDELEPKIIENDSEDRIDIRIDARQIEEKDWADHEPEFSEALYEGVLDVLDIKHQDVKHFEWEANKLPFFCIEITIEIKMHEKKELVFISRHEPNDGQVALAKKLGYSGIKQIPITFGDDPEANLLSAGIEEKKISIVAPSHVTNILLNKGYTLIEFINSPVKREKMMFCCEGAYEFKLESAEDDISKSFKDMAQEYPYAGANFPSPLFYGISQKYWECPISIDEQYESSLI